MLPTTAFAAMPTCTPSLRSAAMSTLRMSTFEDGKPKDLSKGNSFLDVAVDSMRRLFTKSEDEYPSMNDPNAMGFTMTPKKGTAGKVAGQDWEDEKK